MGTLVVSIVSPAVFALCVFALAYMCLKRRVLHISASPIHSLHNTMYSDVAFSPYASPTEGEMLELAEMGHAGGAAAAVAASASFVAPSTPRRSTPRRSLRHNLGVPPPKFT